MIQWRTCRNVEMKLVRLVIDFVFFKTLNKFRRDKYDNISSIVKQFHYYCKILVRLGFIVQYIFERMTNDNVAF